MDSIAFISQPPDTPAPIYVLAGDEDFLKRQVQALLRPLVLGDDDSFGPSSYAGDKAEFGTIRDELETVALFGERRLVIVDNADPFVTEYRGALEKYASAPAKNGVLVLDVKTWPSTTRLAKMLTGSTIVCKAPTAQKLPQWCVGWAKSKHGKQLSAPAAQLLVDLVGNEMGMLEQEIAKLAVYIGKKQRIDADDVDLLVGRSQSANVFKIFDALGAGNLAEALVILNRLFEDGEDAFRILGACSMQIRRVAQVARLTRQGVPLSQAFDLAGIPAWPAARQSCEQQLRHLGRGRADQLFDWLLEVDLGVKGNSQLSPRALLERLLVRLGQGKEAPVQSR